MKTIYTVTEYGIERKNFGGHVDWEIVTDGDCSETFDTIEEAKRAFNKWASTLRGTYMTERASAPRLTMVGRGYRLDLEKYTYEDEEAAENGYWDKCEIIDEAEYTSDDYDAEQEVE